MSNIQCEIDESVAAVSSVVDAEIIVVVTQAAVASNVVSDGVTPKTTIENGHAVSTATFDVYTLTNEHSNASDLLTAGVVATLSVASSGVGKSQPFVVFNEAVSEHSGAFSSTSYEVPVLLSSTAAAASVAFVSTHSVTSLAAAAAGVSSASPGSQYSITEHAAAVSTVLSAARSADSEVDEHATVTGTAYANNTPQALISEHAVASAAVPAIHLVSGVLLIEEAAEACGRAWARNPGALAWVLNTETTAASWYTNYTFDSLAQMGSNVIATSPDGLYLITGGDDAGQPIDSEVKYGFTDFGTAYEKRLDNVYFGYTSDGTIRLELETYGDDFDPQTYVMEARPGKAPRTSRAVPGKGLYSRYWRMTVSNDSGAAFKIVDTTTDLAISKTRRL